MVDNPCQTWFLYSVSRAAQGHRGNWSAAGCTARWDAPGGCSWYQFPCGAFSTAVRVERQVSCKRFRNAIAKVKIVQAVLRIRTGSGEIFATEGDVCSLLGYEHSQLVSGAIRFSDRIHAQDADHAARLFASAETGAETGDAGRADDWISLRVRHQDGRIRCLRARARHATIANEADTLELTLEEARGEGAVEIPPHLLALMDATGDLVYFKDRHHVLIAMNEKLCDAVEIASGGIRPAKGLTDYDLFSEEVADAYYQMEKAIFAGKPLTREIKRTTGRDGLDAWLDHCKYPVKDSKGRVVGLLGVGRHIPGPGEAAAQRENAEQLRQAQRIGGLGSYALEVATGVWTASEVLDEILGIDLNYPHTVEGWLQLVHPEERPSMKEYLRSQVLGNRQPFDRTYRIVRPRDGAERWVLGRGELDLDAEGRVERLRGTIRDVTEQKQREADLHESRDLLQQFITHAPVALAMLDREMRYLSGSRRWLEMFGLETDQILGRSHYEVLPNCPKEWRTDHENALRGEVKTLEAGTLVLPDGQALMIRREVHPWRTGSGEVGGVILFAEDITEQKLAEKRLHLAASVFTHAAEGIVITDARGTILDVNEAFTRITGYTREEAIGQNPRMLKSDRQSPEFYEEMWRRLLKDGKWTGEIWNRAKSGRIFAEMLTISMVPDASGVPQQYLALFSDLTSMKDQERMLERIAQYDLLTGLPNRVLLADRQRQAMAQAGGRGRTMALICLDLDDFKSVNDRLGHNVGDQLLVAAAHRLKAVLRPMDTLARPGGDEFVAVLPDLEKMQDALPLLTQLQAAARTPFEVGQHLVKVSASAGVAFYPQPVDVDADQLLRQASQALYHAKLEGKDCYHVFDLRHDENVRGHHEDLERIRTALARRELVLYYQPRVNMRTGKVIGAEALIRWQHPEAGLLLPGQFLPVLEGSPLAIEVGEWVMDSALRQVEEWNRQGLDLAVSVNVSAQQLQQPEFESRLRALLAAHPGVKPHRFELELLENGALTEMAEVVALIELCGKLGVAFSLDDFGTGYSSLSYLRKLPFDALKIDRTFVRDMLDDPEDLTLLEGVLGLATAFRRQAVAEGVESVEHGMLLLRLGCEQGQGFGIARPMPAAEMAAWARVWRPSPHWQRARTLPPADWPILHAAVEHRAWILSIAEYVAGFRKLPPLMQPSECRFGSWLQSERPQAHSDRIALSNVDALHQKIHSTATNVLELSRTGQKEQAAHGLTNLQALRDQMLEALDRIWP